MTPKEIEHELIELGFNYDPARKQWVRDYMVFTDRYITEEPQQAANHVRFIRKTSNGF